MKKFILSCSVILTILASGCHAESTNVSATTAPVLKTPSNPTTLKKITLEKDEARGVVALTTVSHGCTKAEHFKIETDDQGELVATRLKADRCRRRPFMVTFEYRLDDLPAGN